MNSLWIVGTVVLALTHFSKTTELSQVSRKAESYLSMRGFCWHEEMEYSSVFVGELLCNYREAMESFSLQATYRLRARASPLMQAAEVQVNSISDGLMTILQVLNGGTSKSFLESMKS
jgi:hypothetical protein